MCGESPRQTEDPQSPPCVPYFQGNNGGATYSHGVTGTTINVAFGAFGDPVYEREIDDFVAYFNRRFEFYGRHINAVHAAWITPYTNSSSTQSLIDDATRVDKESHAFLATSFGATAYGDDGAFRDTLARAGVMSTNAADSYVTEATMSAYQPYEWSVLPGLDRQERYLSDMVCGTLAGHAPRLAPPQTSVSYPAGPPIRRWALFSNKPATGGNPPDVSILHNAMSGCGAQPIVEDVLPPNNTDQSQAIDNNLAKMASLDVTTVVCFCDQWTFSVFTSEADKQRRHPEWFISTSFQLDRDELIANSTNYPTDQSSNAFGVSWFNQSLPPGQTFWHQAMREVDPNDDGYYFLPAEIYRDLLLVASGIQMAGPNLTPTTFQEGLYKARFSNSGNGGPPYYEANVGFAPGSHSQYQDARLIWWNPGGQSYNSSTPGTFCAVNNGQRYFLGGLPKDDSGFKQGTC